MNRLNPKVDAYLRRAKKWQEEMGELRRIILECPLTEELKWRTPCYTFEEKNVVLINAVKDYCALAFFKGALLKDLHDILVKAGENTQAARLIKFTDMQQILDQEEILKSYIEQAIEIEKAGLKVEFKKNPEPVPEELHDKFEEMPEFKAAFEALTPGRQRAYILHFSQPKQAKTRTSRIEKCMPKIFEGKGLNDDYMAKIKKKKPRPKR